MNLDRHLPKLLWGTAALLVAGVVVSAAVLLGSREAEALAAFSRRLAQVLRQNLQLQDLALLSADGRVLSAAEPSSSRLGLAMPQGFITSVLAQPAPALQISPPMLHPATAEAVVYLARPVHWGGQSLVLAAAMPVSLLAGIACR